MLRRTFVSLILLTLFSLTTSNLYSQIEVVVDNAIAIGPSLPVDEKVRLYNSDQLTTLKLQSYFNGNTATQYGIHSLTSTGGLGAQYGIYNRTNQVAGNDQAIYGIYNDTDMKGIGSGANQSGLYNIWRTSSTGVKYGIYNYGTSGGDGTRVGFQNSLIQAGTGDRKGISNSVIQSFDNGTVRGLENLVHMLGASGVQTSAGIFNYLYFNSSLTSGSKYGIYSNMHKAGTGNRHGLYNITQQSETSGGSDLIFGAYNRTFLLGGGSGGYGIYNYVDTDAPTSSGSKFGIYNLLESHGSGARYALFSSVTGGGDYAGYFAGNVHVTGTLTYGSDEKLKEDIEEIPDVKNQTESPPPQKV